MDTPQKVDAASAVSANLANVANLEAFSLWLRRSNSSPHTTRIYARWLTEFSLFLEQSGRMLSAIIADEHERSFAVRDWRTFLRQSRHLAPATINQALAALHTFWQFKGLSGPNVKREDQAQLAPRTLSPDEQRRLLHAVERLNNLRDKAIACTLFYTGLRIAEAEALDIDDVIASNQRGKLIVRKGKGDHQREVPLHPAAHTALVIYCQERQERHGNSSPALFLNEKGGRLTTRSIYRLIDKLSDDAGVVFSLRVLRHMFASNLIREGQDIVQVAYLMGHSRLATVRRYTFPTPQDADGQGSEGAVDSIPDE